MPHIVRWSPRAIADVRRVYRFLAEKDPEAAKAAATCILRQAEILESFPNAGRPAEDLEPEHRELPVSFGAAGYVLLYRREAADGEILVLALRHQREVGY